MKKISMFFILLILIILSCARGPSDSEILEIVQKEERFDRPGNLLLQMEIVNREKSRELHDEKVYPVTIRYKHIIKGLKYGYVYGGGGVYHGPHYKDLEFEIRKKFFLGKNRMDEWAIVDSKLLNRRDIKEYKRPESKSMEVFYKDKIKTSKIQKSVKVTRKLNNEWLKEDVKSHYIAFGDSVESVDIVNVSGDKNELRVIADVSFNRKGKVLIRQHELRYVKKGKEWKNVSYSMPPLLNDYQSPYKKRGE